MMSIDLCMVKNHSLDTQNGIIILLSCVYYMALLYDFWSSLVMSALSQIAYLLILVFLYEENITAAILNCLINSVQIFFTLIICYVVIT